MGHPRWRLWEPGMTCAIPPKTQEARIGWGTGLKDKASLRCLRGVSNAAS
jgi:hypothetical protein